MEEEKKQEEVKEEVKDTFERDAKLFLVDLGLLQKKYNLVMRAIITPFGPDINLSRKK